MGTETGDERVEDWMSVERPLGNGRNTSRGLGLFSDIDPTGQRSSAEDSGLKNICNVVQACFLCMRAQARGIINRVWES